VPSAPGGAPDVLMRALSAQLSQQLGVPIVIDNKPGGSYTIGTMELVRSPADGYTLAYGNVVSLATNRSLLPNVPYDVDRDLTLVSNAVRVVNLLAVSNNVPVKTVPELIAYAKKNPGKVAFASDGNGTTAHLGVELFKSMTGTFMLHVPYKAASSAVTDLIRRRRAADDGQHAGAGPARAERPHPRAGHLLPQALAHLSRRAPIADAVPGFEVVAWGGIVAPANLPKDIVTRLNAEIRTALATRRCRSVSGCWAPRPRPARPRSSASCRGARPRSGRR
jgi:tripartite-type tricarboxylate transporter receptor subunit TctC